MKTFSIFFASDNESDIMAFKWKTREGERDGKIKSDKEKEIFSAAT